MALGGILPTSIKHRNSSWTFRRILRPRERLCLIAAVTVCMIPFLYFMSELKGGLNNQVDIVYKGIQNVGPELILPLPPLGADDKSAKLSRGGIHNHDAFIHDLHHIDRERLREKIENDDDLKYKRVLEKPLAMGDPKLKDNVENNKEVVIDSFIGGDASNAGGEVGESENPMVKDGEDRDPDTKTRRNKVKEMMQHAWTGYKTYAWGKNELRPISRRGHSAGIFGNQDMGATIVDALDTLYIMGLENEYTEARNWVEANLDFSRAKSDMSVFETNIRFVGGLLSMFALSGEAFYREKALHVASRLLPAFQTKTGIPKAIVNMGSGSAKNYAWASGGSSILSEFGTLHLEFTYLSHISGDPVFKEKVMRIRDVVGNMSKPDDGLYPNYLSPETGLWAQHHFSLGALGDSFYEYLLKAWVQSGGRDTTARDLYLSAMDAVTNKLLMTSKSGLTYLAEKKQGRLEHKMDHLACFAAGMFALGHHSIGGPRVATHMATAEGLAHTCHESYNRTATGLGPESFRFTESIEARALKSGEKYYILRPEVVEGWFYLWRYTGQQKYRDWAWDMVQALEKHCRVENGYTGLQNVYLENSHQDDVQQSFFFAETLKYLYLIFSDNALLSLDQWVFNTEAHPLPVLGRNSFYRMADAAKLNHAGEKLN